MRSIGRNLLWSLFCVLAMMAVALASGCDSHPVAVEPVATTITISPGVATLKDAGETVELTATVKDQNGETMTDVAVDWSSSDTFIVQVSESGLVTAGETGTATVQASVGTLAYSEDQVPGVAASFPSNFARVSSSAPVASRITS